MLTNRNRELFAEFIKGKSVSIVGRSAYLNDIEQGDKIDGADIVIRMHSNLPYSSPPHHVNFDDSSSFVPISHHSRIGKRTSAYAPANLCDWNTGEVSEFMPRIHQCGCEWIIMHRPYHISEGRAQILPNLDKKMSILDYTADKFLPVFVTPESTFQDLMREMDYCFPMPGTSLINDIVKLNPSAVYVTGFACYMDWKHVGDKAIAELFRSHKPLYDLRYLRDLHRSGKIETDEVMLKYFEAI